MFRTSELEAAGVGRRHLPRLVRQGALLQMARGVYLREDAPLHSDITIAAVATRVRGSCVCLLTALLMNDIGTQMPKDVWIAIDPKARKPRVRDLPIRVVRFGRAATTYGIETRDILGVPVRITSAARTVVDCFRYRNKVGIDVAIEALKDVVRRRMVSLDAIHRAAVVLRAANVMSPYLETVVA